MECRCKSSDLKVTKNSRSFCIMNGVSKIGLADALIFNPQAPPCVELSYPLVTFPKRLLVKFCYQK